MSDESHQISFRTMREQSEQLEDRTGYPATRGSVHQTARDLLKRYVAIMERSLPDLSEEEWNVVFDIYNGTITEPWALSIAYANLEDTPESVFRRHGVEKDELVGKARDWSIAESAAVIDMAEQFWSASAKGQPFDLNERIGREEKGGGGTDPSGDGAAA